MIKGYICRSRINKKGSNWINICAGTDPPSQEDGWFWYVPGRFCTMPIRAFKKAFGFSIKPGTHQQINISILKGE